MFPFPIPMNHVHYSIQAYRLNNFSIFNPTESRTLQHTGLQIKQYFLSPPPWISTPQITGIQIQEFFPPTPLRITHTTEYGPTDSCCFTSSVRLYRVNYTLQAHICKEMVPWSDFGRTVPAFDSPLPKGYINQSEKLWERKEFCYHI
jgi:hypothetical protein